MLQMYLYKKYLCYLNFVFIYFKLLDFKIFLIYLFI